MLRLAGQGAGSVSDARRALLWKVWRVEHKALARVGKWTLLCLVAALVVALEMRTSWLQSRILTAVARRLSFQLHAGPSPVLLAPARGPYDRRLGYEQLHSFQSRLLAAGFNISAQARPSPLLQQIRELTLFPVYTEKSQAGLRVLDLREQPLFNRSCPERVYSRFEDIPPLVVKSLLFVENRELLDARGLTRNPAVEWDRLAKAVVDLGVRRVMPGHPISGGSTLATQLEKVRHSPEGLTSSVPEKARQVASASLRSYLSGENTQGARRRIVLDYVNSLPLASLPGYGEVTGLGDGLWAWYGADFAAVNQLMTMPWNGNSEPGRLREQALAFRQVLSLLLAVRKPSNYLLRDRQGLDARVDGYIRLLAEEGVIGPRLRDAALLVHPIARYRLPNTAPPGFAGRKASDSVRAELLRLLGLDSAYELDRLDLTVKTTLDAPSGDAASRILKQLTDPRFAAAAGILGERLLTPDGLGNVIYSFTLYERTPGANLLRLQVDNLDQPLNVSQSTKLEMGSTAKLRTLVTYLAAVAELHARYTAAPPGPDQVLHPRDQLSQWAIEYLAAAPDKGLPAMLEAAMVRTYSASPGEAFFTGGGLHAFSNFDSKHDGRIMTVREAFQQSVNLVFIRLMRDLAHYHAYRRPGIAPGILQDPDDPRRTPYLERFADLEGRQFLRKFHGKYRGQNPETALRNLLSGLVPAPRRLAAIYRSVKPRATPAEFAAFLAAQPAARNLPPQAAAELYAAYGPDQFDLNDRGYLARVHPLELWMLEYMSRRPQADLGEILTASAAERQEAYRWLFNRNRKHGQDTRIQTLLEVDAFEEMHRQWRRLGYPFPALVPSYATAIGSSGDNPAALAELIGILQNDGLRYPSMRIRQLHFGARTPFETVMRRQPAAPERVLNPWVAVRVRQELLGVVASGTGRRAYRAVVLGRGQTVPVGGKTGTGDNRLHIYGAHGLELGSRAVNRTASFVFFIGDRFYGSVMAYVPGAEAESYHFTSALPVQVFTKLIPAIRPLLEPPPHTAVPAQVAPELQLSSLPSVAPTRLPPAGPSIASTSRERSP
jgi:membrane peptidoglycan carboxypeptidase